MATKKASTEYTQKETRKKSKCATIKNQLDTKEGNKGGNEGQKSCRKHAENKWQMAEVSLSLSVIAFNVNRLNSLQGIDWQNG